MNLESSLTYFNHTNIDEVKVLLSIMNKTTCMFDPFPTRLLLDFSHLFIEVIVRIINLTFSTASFPVATYIYCNIYYTFALFLTYHSCLS